MQSNPSYQSLQVPKAIANIPQGLQSTANAHQMAGGMGPGGGAGGVPMPLQSNMLAMGQQQRMMVGQQQQQQPPQGVLPQQMHMGAFDPQQRPVGMMHPNMQRPNMGPGGGGMAPGTPQPQQQQMVPMPQQTPSMGYPNSQSYFKYNHGFLTNSSQVACER